MHWHRWPVTSEAVVRCCNVGFTASCQRPTYTPLKIWESTRITTYKVDIVSSPAAGRNIPGTRLTTLEQIEHLLATSSERRLNIKEPYLRAFPRKTYAMRLCRVRWLRRDRASRDSHIKKNILRCPANKAESLPFPAAVNSAFRQAR